MVSFTAEVVWDGLSSIGRAWGSDASRRCMLQKRFLHQGTAQAFWLFRFLRWTSLGHSYLHAYYILLPFQRVGLYNALATSLMCQAGLEVLDVYPFTRSYPGGTGGPEVAHYKEHDTVHFKYLAMKPLDLFLKDYFLGKVPLSIDLQNYQFS